MTTGFLNMEKGGRRKCDNGKNGQRAAMSLALKMEERGQQAKERGSLRKPEEARKRIPLWSLRKECTLLTP